MKQLFIPALIAATVFVSCSPGAVNNKETTSASAKDDTWKSVVLLTGKNDSVSTTIFRLSGKKARLKYLYNGENTGGGTFSVYVIEKGKDFENAALRPDLSLQREKAEDSNPIHKPAGEYYFDVSATGTWSVEVQEAD